MEDVEQGADKAGGYSLFRYIFFWERNISWSRLTFFVLVKNLVGGRTYYFRIFAHGGPDSYEGSEEVKFSVPARVKHKV